MKSPFPGMDPYIEACGLWEDFHTHLIAHISDVLADAAPARYVVRAGEPSYVVLVDSEAQARHAFLPDVGVMAPQGRKGAGAGKGGTTIAERGPERGAEHDQDAVSMRAFIEETYREAFVEVYTTTPAQRLVTCIEVLSPSNKRPGSPGWELYQRKRQGQMLAGINLDEIDLLRGGERMPM